MSLPKPVNPPKILFLNGPPGCGKDTIAGLLCAGHTNTHLHIKFAAPLKTSFCSLLGITVNWFEDHKDDTAPNADGQTYRELIIDFSENYMKPTYGEDFLGRRLFDAIEDGMTLLGRSAFIISDSGFPHEAAPIIKAYGRENCAIAKVVREGTTFKGDSRAYWEPRDDIIKQFEIINNETITTLSRTLKKEIQSWLV